MEPRDIIRHPEDVLGLSLDKTYKILKKVDRFLEELNEPALVDFQTPDSKSPGLIMIGDTHGDYTTTRSALYEFFFESIDNITPKEEKHVLFLGDYLDRPPGDCENGSFVNIMYVLALKMLYPDRVTLLRGNHESFELIPCPPWDLPGELTDLYGDDGYNVLERFKPILRNFPLLYRSDNGIFAVHSGIFKRPKSISELKELDRSEMNNLAVTTWAEPVEHAAPRLGINEIYNYNYDHFKNFMVEVDSNVLVRGHTPSMVGKASYENRCITLFTNRYYVRHLGERALGVLTAPLD
jgi:hypothetical protein